MAHRAYAVLWVAAGLAICGVAWLAPLMLDQFVLFSDQEQTAVAVASRAVMIWPTILILVGASLVAFVGRGREAAVVAAPVAAVVLAHTSPERAWQLLAYGVTAPIALGAVLAAVAPIRNALGAPAVLAALLVAGFAAALSTLFLVALVIIGLIAWWLLSRASTGPSRIPPHRR